MNAAILSRWFTGPASPKEHRSAIANHAIRRLNTRFVPISDAQPGERPHNPVADKLSANQVRLAALMAVVLRL
ncbi:MAG: hypothetical protein WAK31_26050 [Chthoniobacterales bacterium]